MSRGPGFWWKSSAKIINEIYNEVKQCNCEKDEKSDNEQKLKSMTRLLQLTRKC